MSDINFCNTKEQLNHLGEVVTGKVDGSPAGADIDTSTLPYTGQVRKTLPALEGEYEQSITNKEVEADAAIDSYRLLNKGPYASGITLESKFEYITYNGESYFATNPPYATTATTPDADGNLFLGGYTTFENVANKIGNKNELSNSNFLTPSPDAITHPNAAPESYVAGTQIFSGVYAGDSGCTITLIDGRVNCTAGDYQFKVPNATGLERVPVFTSSVSDYDGIPKTTGVSHALVGDEYVVTVTPAAGDVFSVKLEQGSVATRHEVQTAKGQLYTFNSVADAVSNCPSIGSRVVVEDYYGGTNSNDSGVLFFRVVPAGTGVHDGGKYIDADATKQLVQNLKKPFSVLAWGARRNRVSDDTSPIQSTIDYAESYGTSSQVQSDNPTVFINAGAYLCTELLIPSNITIAGDGRTSSVLILEKSATTLLKRKYSNSATFNVVMSGIGLSPDDPAANLPTGQTLFDIRGFTKSLFEDFGVYWCGGCDGISSNEASYTASTNWYLTFNHVFVERLATWPEGGKGWHIGSNDTAYQQSTTWTWLGGRTSGAGGVGSVCFDFEGCSTMSLFGHTIEGGAIYVGSNSGDRATRAVIFHSAYAEGVSAFDFRGSTEFCGILGGRVTGVTVTDTGTNNTLLLESTVSMPVGNAGTAVYELVQQGARYPKVRSKWVGSPVWQFENQNGGQVEILGAGDYTNSAFRFFANNASDGIVEMGTLVLRPAITNTMKLGEASRLWTEVFASNGSINTSDATLKTEVRQLTDNEIEAAKALSKEIGAFQWLDSVEAKGDKAREHIGMTVQRAIEVMESFGLKPFNYGFICFDEWDDEFDEHGKMTTEAGQRYSFRPDQLDRFISRGLRSEIDDIKDRLNKAGL